MPSVTLNRLKQLSNAVTLQLNNALSTPPDNFCLEPKRMYYLLFIKATLFINFCATAIVGMWAVLFKGYNRGLSSTCPKSFSRSIFLRTKAHWPALANQSEALKLKLPFLLLDNTFYKTLHAHVNIMITNFLLLPMAVLLLIFPPLKPCNQNIQTKFMQTKRIRLWSKNYTLVSAPSIGHFFYQSRCSSFPFVSFLSIVSLYK